MAPSVFTFSFGIPVQSAEIAELLAIDVTHLMQEGVEESQFRIEISREGISQEDVNGTRPLPDEVVRSTLNRHAGREVEAFQDPTALVDVEGSEL
ncbi:hypothetical protein F5Y07DRAFT_404853 [Xylaria sp. FL0933]|nr:hypothetical protein F5Y07DRAFT_404853 [Xylaria sp. FL0933]